MSEQNVKVEVFKKILDDMCPFCRKRAMHILADATSVPAPKPLVEPLVELLTRICTRNGLDNSIVINGPQTASLVRVRQEFSVEAHKLGYSFPEIGRAINRHHTSIVHLVHKNGNGHQ